MGRQDKTTKLISWGLVVCVVPFLSGCLTQQLWQSDVGLDRHWAAAEPNLKLYETRNHKDILVEYDEDQDKDTGTRRRAFLLNANERPLMSGREPHFVSARKSEKLQAVPIERETSTNPANQGAGTLKAVLSQDGHQFSLVSDGREIGSYTLPSYVTGYWVRVALTPAAATGDAVIVATVLGAIWAYAYAQGGGTIHVKQDQEVGGLCTAK